jgi:SAM-dependent methyltransferase
LTQDTKMDHMTYTGEAPFPRYRPASILQKLKGLARTELASVKPIYHTGRRAFRDVAEAAFRRTGRKDMSRGGVLSMVPPYSKRQGSGLGTVTYGEWCYTVGIFQSIMFQNLPEGETIDMLDVGCGLGRLYLSSKAFLNDGGSYTGIDIGTHLIDDCKAEYAGCDDASFVHYDAANAIYSNSTKTAPQLWPLGDKTYNFITALSVWTHLREEDWCAYLRQVSDRLTDDGRAMISFFILDDDYDATLPGRTDKISKYYPQPETKWIFDAPAYGSENWSYPSWAPDPEVAIGVRKAAFDAAVAEAGLVVDKHYPGSWKERSGLFFQDIVIFKKA